MKLHLYIQNILLGLFVIYFAQGSLYDSGSNISQGTLAIIFVVAIIYFFKTLLLKGNKNPLYKVWTALLLLNLVGFIFTGSLSNPNHFGMLKRVSIALFSFYPFYYFATHNILQRKHLLFFFFVMIPISILAFYYNQTQILTERNYGNENVVNNMAYRFVNLIPFVFLIKNKKIISIGSMMILLYFIVIGSKRGALITGSLGFLIYGYYFLKNSEAKFRIKNYFFGILAIGVIAYFAYQQLEANEYFLSRLEKTGQVKEVRNINFASLWNAWVNSDSYFNLIFGFGFASSIVVGATGNFAHNDWLELLSNFGLIGVFLYAFLFYEAFRMIYKNKWFAERKYLMLCILTVWFLPTLFSMGIYDEGFVFIVIPLTYLMKPADKIK